MGSYQTRSQRSNYNRQSNSRTIYSVQASRSKKAKALDSVLKAPLAETDDQWMNNPSHYDWPNLDTPKPKEQSIETKSSVTEVKPEPKLPKAFEYWLSLTPMQRYGIMKNLDLRGKKDAERWKMIYKYIDDNKLYDKKTPEIKKLEPQIINIEQKPVLVQPEIVKTNSIPEVMASFPNKAKTYAEGGQSFEVLEGEYIARQIEKNMNRYSANIKWCQEQINNVKVDPHLTERKKQNKIAEFDSNIRFSNSMLERLEKPESRATYEHSYKEDYIKFIKDSIKHGKPVPQEIVLQRPEFQVAQDARRRYEKGLHTSFANKSAAVNAVMFLEKGYKVKRQDGKAIIDYQIREIDQGITNIQQTVGPIKDVMQKADLTIAHTSGKYPFLMVAGGVYHPTDKTITMGIGGIRSLAHEWAHWLDYEGGRESKYGYEYYTDGKKSKKVDSFKTALSRAEDSSNPLYRNAAWQMNDRYGLRQVYKRAYNKKLSAEEKKDAKEVVARVGGYWGDPREVWARLVEQYVATTLGKQTVAAESPEFYEKHPAYWSKETFAKFQPEVKAELERRISIARGT